MQRKAVGSEGGESSPVGRPNKFRVLAESGVSVEEKGRQAISEKQEKTIRGRAASPGAPGPGFLAEVCIASRLRGADQKPGRGPGGAPGHQENSSVMQLHLFRCA